MFIFLPLVLLVYYVLPGRTAKNIVLVIASLLFYIWGEYEMFVVLIVSVVINYLCGLLIHYTKNFRFGGKPALALGIALNLGMLGYFKYFDFVIKILNSSLLTKIPLQNIVLPVGISFFTFQGLTYIIDLYRGKFPPQKNPLKLCLYVMKFPALTAGPIVRYGDMEAMIDGRRESVSLFTEGVSRFICGLAKKVLIANTVAVVCDAIFMAPVDAHSAAALWIGAVAYTLQIYFDFSGYSDMAIGLGLMFGFRFKENFDHPYSSCSIREFWRRWHISLSSFFRDYLYIPLGGNKRGIVYVNLIIVFFATGLWHGANYTFIVWGLWHGLFIIIENILRRNAGASAIIDRVKNLFTVLLARAYTLLVVVVGWVVFRSDSLSYAMEYIKRMLLFQPGLDIKVSSLFYLNNFNILVFVLAALFSFPLAGALRSLFRDRVLADRGAAYQTLRIACLAFLLFWSAVNLIDLGYNPFIYFRF